MIKDIYYNYKILVILYLSSILDWISTYFSLKAGNIESNIFYYTLLQGNIYYFLIWKLMLGLFMIYVFYKSYENIDMKGLFIKKEYQKQLIRYARKVGQKEFYLKNKDVCNSLVYYYFFLFFWYLVIYFLIGTFIYLTFHNFSII